MRQCQTECMASPLCGFTCFRPGSPLWRKWSGNWPSWSPVDPIGCMPWCSSTETPTMYHSPRSSHLGILTEEGTNSTACGQICQLEVCQFLTSGLQVVYLMGLNGHEVSMIVLPPESLARGTTLIGGKLTYPKMSIPQPTPEGQEPKALPHSSHCSPIQVPSPIKAPLPKAEREVSMMMEVRELLSWAVLDMSGHASGNSTPKGLNPMVVLMPLPPKLGAFLVQRTHPSR